MEETILSWDHVASGFGLITTILLTYLLNKLGKLEQTQEEHIRNSIKEMGEKESYDKCKEFRDECTKGKHHTVECDLSATKRRVEQVQDNLDFHSHTGIPTDSAVIKKRNNHG